MTLCNGLQVADFADARVQLHTEWMLPGARRQEQHHIFPLQVLGCLSMLREYAHVGALHVSLSPLAVLRSIQVEARINQASVCNCPKSPTVVSQHGIRFY